MNIQRILKIDLPARQSAFLWGPRKTGKTTYLKGRFPKSLVYDFLDTRLFLEFSKRPFLLREQLLEKEKSRLEQPVILDEVQKVPQILDEVQWLIENTGIRFILCGSSARKLKRGRANLLGGRAWRCEMHPLVIPEVGDPRLLKILNGGMLPSHFLEEDPRKSLQSYVQDYLKEEVFEEGLTRNIPAFSRFFDAVGYSHGELINYSNIARDCGVDSKTVREYFQILCDTLLGYRVEPYKKKQSRQVIGKASKFYFFDVGVAGVITKRSLEEERGAEFGKAFEHFIFTEISAYRSYRALDFDLHFWRTKSGLEVDFVLGDAEIALEIKGSPLVDSRELKALKAFRDEFNVKQALLVCNERSPRLVDGIRILPWRVFLEELWSGKIIH